MAGGQPGRPAPSRGLGQLVAVALQVSPGVADEIHTGALSQGSRSGPIWADVESASSHDQLNLATLPRHPSSEEASSHIAPGGRRKRCSSHVIRKEQVDCKGAPVMRLTGGRSMSAQVKQAGVTIARCSAVHVFQPVTKSRLLRSSLDNMATGVL